MTLAEELNELLPAKWYSRGKATSAQLNVDKFSYGICVDQHGEQYTVTMRTRNGNARSNLINRERLASFITHFTANVAVFSKLFGGQPVVPVWAQETFDKQFSSFVKDDTQ